MKNEWQKKASNMIKAEITRKGISYQQLQEMLAEIGVEETSSSINVKINRGAFAFIFFLQVMQVLGAKTLRLEDD
jgi:hypothetical protein